jgi:pimeloyl-ACP methyl ester carboxylesterase
MLEAKSIKIPSNDEQLELSYFDVGTADRTLVCFHGIQGSKSTFERLINSPLPKQIRVVIPDIPGFGESKGPTDGTYDLTTQSKRLLLMLDELQLKQVVLFGHSLGGMLATILLEAIPDRVEALISSEGNLTLEDCGESRRVSAIDFNEFNTLRFPEIKKKGITASPEAFYATSRSVVEVSKSRHHLNILKDSKIPVLFIRGSKSHFATEPVGTNVQTLMIHDLSHLTLANSEQVVIAISEFLAKLGITTESSRG